MGCRLLKGKITFFYIIEFLAGTRCGHSTTVFYITEKLDHENRFKILVQV